MKLNLLIATIAACALMSLSAAAQNTFPAPPPELSGPVEFGGSVDYGPSIVVGGEAGALEEGLSFADSEESGPVMLMAQATAPAPPKGGGDTVYMTQGPGPGGPGDHFQMRVGGPRKWWKDSNTVKQLQLSDAQATQIEQAFTDSKMRLIDMVAALQKEELKLETLINADQPNENAVSNQVDQVVQARGKLEKEHAMMMLNIRRLLSLDQWKKLQSIDGGMGMGMGHRMFVRRFHGPPPQGPPPPDGPQAPE
jgi:Spy/CpxP family protein refolding chaperone